MSTIPPYEDGSLILYCTVSYTKGNTIHAKWILPNGNISRHVSIQSYILNKIKILLELHLL